MTREDIPVQQDTRRVLCCLRTYMSGNVRNLPLLDGVRRAEGDILLGCCEDEGVKPTMENLRKTLSGTRWVFNRIVTGRGTKESPSCTIVGSPTLLPINRIQTTCHACGTVRRTVKDLVIRSSTDKDGRPACGWHEDNKYPCPDCGSMETEQIFLRCLALPAEKPRDFDDPVLSDDPLSANKKLGLKVDDILDGMLKAWTEGPDAQGLAIQVPRLWGMYHASSCPDQAWTPDPTDARAVFLDQWAKEKSGILEQRKDPETGKIGWVPVQQPMRILPFSLASQYHRGPEPVSGAPVEWKLEAEQLAVGWVRIMDLYPQDQAFKVRLWK